MKFGDQRHTLAALSLGKSPVHIVQEAEWAPKPVWAGVQNFVLTGVRYPDRPISVDSAFMCSAFSYNTHWLFPMNIISWMVLECNRFVFSVTWEISILIQCVLTSLLRLNEHTWGKPGHWAQSSCDSSGQNLYTIMPCLQTLNKDASRAFIQKYANLKRKIYYLSANICFNQTCLRNNTSPNFPTVKISNISPVSNFTQHKSSITRTRDGIKIPWLKTVYIISSDNEPQEGLGAKTDRLIGIFKVTWTWTALKGYAGREFYFFCTKKK